MPSVLVGLTGEQLALLRVLPVPADLVPTPLTSQRFGAGFPVGIEARGPHSSKSTFPVASSGLVAPVTVIVALSVTAVPGWTVPGVPSWFAATDCWVVRFGEQRWKLPRILSCSSESPAAEERLLIRKLEKQAPPNPRPVRLSPPSKKVERPWTVSALNWSPTGFPWMFFWGRIHGEAVTVVLATAQALSGAPIVAQS